MNSDKLNFIASLIMDNKITPWSINGEILASQISTKE